VEIDDFHEINAQYGFKEGEYIMRSISRILSSCIRDDDFLSHQSCERYVVLIKNIQGDVIRNIGERFLDSLNKLNASHGKPYTISISWGYCHAGIDSDFEKVYLEAEADLSRKKHLKDKS
jgi:diguanylate cyclase (GGDEF)-like protein